MATITGTNGTNSLRGTSGNDQIFGLGGNDVIFGSAGSDSLDGGDGSDTVDYSQLSGAVQLDMNSNTVTKDSGGADTLVSIGLAVGSNFNDSLLGNNNANTLQGGLADDFLMGQGGRDTLDGGPGSDTVSYEGSPAGVSVDLAAGTAQDGFGTTDRIVSVGLVIGTPDYADVLIGNDNANTINGIGGANRLTGNGGPDTFVMNSWDWWGSTITDFRHGTDKITVDLHSTPVTGYSAGPLNASRFTTGDPTTSQWTFLYDRSTGVVSFDTDGNGPDGESVMVTLENRPDLSAGDFLLT
ncbi:MAG: hypothetical protein H7Z12_18145 [Rhodospirillaceae bacterium]|nr:hypothetical protein [Rhodospirillales bacterium]